jgi:hypothetical protein
MGGPRGSMCCRLSLARLYCEELRWASVRMPITDEYEGYIEFTQSFKSFQEL